MNSPDTGTTVYYTLDLDAPISQEAIAELNELNALDDSDIDFSDIPPQIVDETWYRPKWAIAVARHRMATGRGDEAIERMLREYVD